MNKTKIEWTNYTWNIITGCLGPNGIPSKPQRCPYCYAHRLARGRLKNLYLSWKQLSSIPFLGEPLLSPNADSLDPFAPRFWPSRLDEPRKLREPSKIFVCSMGEMFGDWIPAVWIYNILNIFWECFQHTFQVLTKNPKKALHFAFPNNVWLGATLNSFNDWGRGYFLRESSAKVKFISFEPLLGSVFTSSYGLPLDGINWIIIGAQTQPLVPPKREWIESIIMEADNRNIPIFLKNNLKSVMGEDLRQEFPK